MYDKCMIKEKTRSLSTINIDSDMTWFYIKIETSVTFIQSRDSLAHTEPPLDTLQHESLMQVLI